VWDYLAARIASLSPGHLFYLVMVSSVSPLVLNGQAPMNGLGTVCSLGLSVLFCCPATSCES
jgi:hypothetical protein